MEAFGRPNGALGRSWRQLGGNMGARGAGGGQEEAKRRPRGGQEVGKRRERGQVRMQRIAWDSAQFLNDAQHGSARRKARGRYYLLKQVNLQVLSASSAQDLTRLAARRRGRAVFNRFAHSAGPGCSSAVWCASCCAVFLAVCCIVCCSVCCAVLCAAVLSVA